MSHAACNLVTNFEAALIKKLWQYSVLSCTLYVATPSPLPHFGGGIPAIFQLVCHAFLSITFAFSSYPRSAEAHYCPLDRRETGTHLGQMGKTKNCIRYQIQKPVSIFHENQKPNAKKLKICKPQ